MIGSAAASSAQFRLLWPDSTGKERDAETGLDYFLARYYSGAQGRFLSPDEFKGGPDDALTGKEIAPPGPLPYADIANPQTLNKYTYVVNNPLRYIDPDGHCFDPTTCGLEFAGIGSLGGFIGTGVGAVVGVAAGAAIVYIGYKAVENHQSHNSNGNTKSQNAKPTTQDQTQVTTPPPPGNQKQDNKKNKTEHGQERADQARAGDTHREVGDPNRTIQQGRQFRDTETGNTVNVRGNRVVITDSEGNQVSQFKNTRANTLKRIENGKWEPIP